MDDKAPTNQFLPSIFSHRKGRFSDFWFLIFQARFLLGLVVLLFAQVATPETSVGRVRTGAVVYLAIVGLLGFISRPTLRRKRIRALPAVLDVVFTSYLVFLTGGQNSNWYLLYIFPVLSVSRYLSYEGSVLLALVAATSYAVAALAAGGAVNPLSLVLKGMILLGISFVAGNLNRKQRRKEDELADIFRNVDNDIIDNVETNLILQNLLASTVTITESELGQLIVFAEDQLSDVISFKTDTKQSDWNVQPIAARFHSMVRETKQRISVASIIRTRGKESIDKISYGKKGHVYVLRMHVEKGSDIPRSALFVPLVLNKEVRAIISLYSKDGFHYFDFEVIRLENLAPALGIVLKHSSEIEKTQRLKLLHTIGEALKVEQGLSEVFKTVVALAWNQLGSEEAALFVSKPIKGNELLIEKVAVEGPTREITAKLKEFEPPYGFGVSLVGTIFASKQEKHLAEVPPSTLHHKPYSETLPSKMVRHYIGVPIIIGDQVLGVLRVINKRASSYDIENKNYDLAETGFSKEDLELMQTIASQVASAIRSANFIEVNSFYRELVENSPDPIIVLDPEGEVRIFNRACEKIWGYYATEVIGTKVERYYESKEHARHIGKLLHESPGHRIHDFNARILARNGEVIPIGLSASFLFDKDGKELGSIGVFKDLRFTQKLQAEKTAAERLATLGRLAHTVGHEIKHDIATALNYVETLVYEFRDDEELTQIYRDIQDALIEAKAKFQNMLLVGRPKFPEKRLIEVAEVFELVETSMRRTADGKKVELLMNYPDDTTEMEADISQLRQVLFNLFDNSIDAIATQKVVNPSGEQGRIVCVAEACNGNLKIDWTDNGCGISAKNLATIFTAFVTTKPTGNGLGLFIVKSIIENHDGKIAVESLEGKGTTFRITLPLRADKSHEQQAKEDTR
jgi:PAS domain S-box-containing protein